MDGDPKDAAQVALAASDIRPGDVYRHYKGGLYVVVCLSVNEASLEPMVTYRSNAKGTIWTRTLKNFADLIFVEDEGSSQPASVVVSRFTRETG